MRAGPLSSTTSVDKANLTFVQSAVKHCTLHIAHCTLHIELGTIPSNGGYRPIIKNASEYDELASHVLAEFMKDLHRITKENLTISTDFQMLLEHCRKYDLAHTQADSARVVHLSVATVHELATGKFPPGLANLVRIVVTCEVSLAGLICSEL